MQHELFLRIKRNIILKNYNNKLKENNKIKGK